MGKNLEIVIRQKTFDFVPWILKKTRIHGNFLQFFVEFSLA